MTEKTMALIPAYNAAHLLQPVVEGALKVIADVVVVDDGSADGTSEVARKAGARVVRHEKNRGKGAALKTGFQYALEQGFDSVVTLDADGQHLPQEIPRFIDARRTSGADLIIGSRSRLFKGMKRRRRLANRFSAATISWSSGSAVDDSQSGFRLYSKRLLQSVGMKSDGFAAESEIIVRAGRGGFHILMIPIDLGFIDGVQTSHYRAVKDTFRIAWVVFRTRFFG